MYTTIHLHYIGLPKGVKRVGAESQVPSKQAQMEHSHSFRGCRLMQGGHLMGGSDGDGKIPSKTSIHARFLGLW